MKFFEIIKFKFLSLMNLWNGFTESKALGEETRTSTPNSNQIRNKQIMTGIGLIAVIAVVIISYFNFSLSDSKASKRKEDNTAENTNPQKIKVEVAGEALDPERMWRHHFEDKLYEAEENMNARLSKMTDIVTAKSEETLQNTKNEMQELKDQLNSARNELQATINELRLIRENQNTVDNNSSEYFNANLESQIIEDETSIAPPKDIKLYIPETSYVSGTLLGGIAVSTSVGSSSEPVPVVIRLTGGGNLPRNFKTNLKECRILGSGYGDLSSERAVIRAEAMVCVDKISEEVITTKIAGIIYGDDGMNGIKGKVVDMSKKHIQSAAIGGMLSGFAGTMKSESQFTISALGAVNTKKRGLDDRFKDNAMSGMGNAAEKIADYYIKQAENMSPVLLISGGSKVDVVFTKGVYLGSNNIAQVIARERKESKNESR